MSNELIEQKTGGLVSAINQQGLGEMLKPLIKEIHLFDSYVAGTTHLEDQTVLDEIKVGDKLSLFREDNKFDSNAIIIKTESQKKLGYVPEKDNIIFARLMDAGKMLAAIIKDIEKKDRFQRSVSVYIWWIFDLTPE